MTGTSMSVASSIAIAQLNPHLGNITANVDRLLEARRGAEWVTHVTQNRIATSLFDFA